MPFIRKKSSFYNCFFTNKGEDISGEFLYGLFSVLPLWSFLLAGIGKKDRLILMLLSKEHGPFLQSSFSNFPIVIVKLTRKTYKDK